MLKGFKKGVIFSWDLLWLWQNIFIFWFWLKRGKKINLTYLLNKNEWIDWLVIWWIVKKRLWHLKNFFNTNSLTQPNQPNINFEDTTQNAFTTYNNSKSNNKNVKEIFFPSIKYSKCCLSTKSDYKKVMFYFFVWRLIDLLKMSQVRS